MGRSLASEPPPKVRRTEPVSADDDENDIDVVGDGGDDLSSYLSKIMTEHGVPQGSFVADVARDSVRARAAADSEDAPVRGPADDIISPVVAVQACTFEALLASMNLEDCISHPSPTTVLKQGMFGEMFWEQYVSNIGMKRLCTNLFKT